ncbi:MAG: PorT family protein [Chitinophagaceae bacterium]|nr:MAG: PorT family protein [Chitinophagaceae bacterium]
MKKSLISALLLAASFYSSAQDYEMESEPPAPLVNIKKVKFGAFIAPNVSWMSPTSSKSKDGLYRVSSNGSNIGFTWGLLADYFFTENYGIASGIHINNTGGNVRAVRRVEGDKANNFVETADFNYRLQYIELPFHLKLRTDEIKQSGFKAFGQLGLTAGINIGKKATYEVSYWDAGTGSFVAAEGDREKLSGSFTIAPVNLQLNIGAGVEKRISQKMSYYLGLFFNNGFLPDATKPEEFDLEYKGRFSDGNVRLNNFAFRLGLFF